LELEQLVEDLEKAAAFEKRWGYLIEDAEKIRKRAMYFPWPFRLYFLFRADTLEEEYQKKARE
jgi:hypothetical protein